MRCNRGTSAYVANRRFVNVEGQDTIPIRLKDDRMAWLTLPIDLRDEDVERITNQLRFIAALGKEAIRPVGPPEPRDKARGWL